jgi:hypothetical protein
MQAELRQRKFEIELAALHRYHGIVQSLIRSLERYKRERVRVSSYVRRGHRRPLAKV